MGNIQACAPSSVFPEEAGDELDEYILNELFQCEPKEDEEDNELFESTNDEKEKGIKINVDDVCTFVRVPGYMLYTVFVSDCVS